MMTLWSRLDTVSPPYWPKHTCRGPSAASLSKRVREQWLPGTAASLSKRRWRTSLEVKILHLKRRLEAAKVSPDDEKKLEGWAKKLKSAFYDAEDIQDAIDYHRLKHKAMLHRQSVNTSKQVRCSVPLYIYEKQYVICSPLVSSSIWHGSHLRNVRV